MKTLVFVWAIAAVLSSQLTAATCPPNPPDVFCFLNPCSIKTCPRGTKCIPDFCGPCRAECVKDTDTCLVNGKARRSGEVFPAPDGCNICSCSNRGEVTCTEAACQQCRVGDKVYSPGENFPAGDGCNVCTCRKSGLPICTLIACPTCEYSGKTHKPGDSFPAEDGCNTCECTLSGEVVCTEKACIDPKCPLPSCRRCTTGYKRNEKGCPTCQCNYPECEGVTCGDDEYCNRGKCCPESDKYRRCSDPCATKNCGYFRTCKRECACFAKCVPWFSKA